MPDDLSVVGFDDSFPAVGTSPPLTTVRQPLTGMARLAMRTTVTWLDDKHRSTPHLQMSTMLIERDTTGAVLP